MSPRRLLVRLATIPPDDMGEYLSRAQHLTRSAATDGGHFWLFRVDGPSSAFMEFLEAADADSLAGLERRAEVLRALHQPAVTGDDNGPGAPREWRCSELRLEDA